jgi:hypothetical protein
MAIKITSNRTIVKNIKVGTPLPAIKEIKIRNSLRDVSDTAIAPQGQIPGGTMIAFDATTEKWTAVKHINQGQVIDGGDTF